jgi:hypothetical protein
LTFPLRLACFTDGCISCVYTHTHATSAPAMQTVCMSPASHCCPYSHRLEDAALSTGHAEQGCQLLLLLLTHRGQLGAAIATCRLLCIAVPT